MLALLNDHLSSSDQAPDAAVSEPALVAATAGPAHPP